MAHPRYPPPITRLLNAARRQDWAALEQAVAEALDYTARLNERAEFVYPLARLEPSDELRVTLDHLIMEQVSALQALAQAAAARGSQDLEELLDRLRGVSADLGRESARLARLLAERPRLADVPLLDDTFHLALALLQGRGGQPEALRQRLPALFAFSRQMEEVLARFTASHPEEGEIRQHMAAGLEELRLALGGLFVYLEEQRDLADLSQALSLLDRATQKLAACLTVMKDLEFQAAEFSEDPALERAHRLARRRAAGQAGPQDRQEMIRLLTWVRDETAEELERNSSATFMGASLAGRYLPAMARLLEGMDEILTRLEDLWERPGELPAELERFRQMGEEFDRLGQELAEELDRQPRLEEAGNFAELLDLMEGVYLERIPEALLQEKVLAMQSSLALYRRRLQAESRRQPERAAELAEIAAILDQQEQGLAEIEACLQTGQRSLLAAAYDLIVPGALKLIEKERERTEAQPASPESPLLCPFCGEAPAPGSRSCPRCHHPLPIQAALGQPWQTRLELGESGGQLEWIVELLRDLASGAATQEEALKLLFPAWQSTAAVEQRLAGEVERLGRPGQDPALQEAGREMLEAVSDLRGLLEDLCEAVTYGQLPPLDPLADQLRHLGGELARMHEEHARAAGQS